jgi:hypothetical protein
VKFMDDMLQRLREWRDDRDAAEARDLRRKMNRMNRIVEGYRDKREKYHADYEAACAAERERDLARRGIVRDGERQPGWPRYRRQDTREIVAVGGFWGVRGDDSAVPYEPPPMPEYVRKAQREAKILSNQLHASATREAALALMKRAGRATALRMARERDGLAGTPSPRDDYETASTELCGVHTTGRRSQAYNPRPKRDEIRIIKTGGLSE